YIPRAGKVEAGILAEQHQVDDLGEVGRDADGVETCLVVFIRVRKDRVVVAEVVEPGKDCAEGRCGLFGPDLFLVAIHERVEYVDAIRHRLPTAVKHVDGEGTSWGYCW